MRVGRILALMLLLTLAGLTRVAISLSGSQDAPATAHPASSQVIASAQAASAATPAISGPMKPAAAPASETAAHERHDSEGLVPKANASPWTPDEAMVCETERKALLGLRDLKRQLEERKRQLDSREQAVAEMEKKAATRIQALEDMEARLQDMLAQEKSINDKKIKRLTAVYEGMKPDKAAPVIARMELPIVVRIFSRMDEKKVGKILSFLPPEQAVKISQALTRRIASLNP
ncbi:MAG: hypothetical protein D6794_05970 [Deltaproteobacteria bacterium]|nr:MAG: hypothetical protein D6794_05970 [Deltaproteobacteria bacterium]